MAGAAGNLEGRVGAFQAEHYLELVAPGGAHADSLYF
jgi:hypothetical protein